MVCPCTLLYPGLEGNIAIAIFQYFFIRSLSLELLEAADADGGAEDGEDAAVPGVDDAPAADLEGQVHHGEALLLDVAGQPLVARRLPVQRRLEAGAGVPGDGQLQQDHPAGGDGPVYDDQVRDLVRQGQVWWDSPPVHPPAG